MIAEKYTYFIKAGVSGSETELISALNEYGDKIMAEAYLNCGNPDLETAAKDWAVAHDYMITSSPNGLNSLSWGSE